MSDLAARARPHGLKAIEATHEVEVARCEAELCEEDRRAREHEAQIEAEALARALRRR